MSNAAFFLHSARPRIFHSAGGLYIAFIAKQMDEEFAGTQLYTEDLLFLVPLSASFVPAQPVWISWKSWLKKLCSFFDKFVWIDFTPFSNFNLLIFRSWKLEKID